MSKVAIWPITWTIFFAMLNHLKIKVIVWNFQFPLRQWQTVEILNNVTIRRS
jgi:hypothetical protein